MNEAKVAGMVRLLLTHHEEEMRLIDRARLGTLGRWDVVEWTWHDVLERDILFAMAEMTEEEIQEAITRYEKEGGYL